MNRLGVGLRETLEVWSRKLDLLQARVIGAQ